MSVMAATTEKCAAVQSACQEPAATGPEWLKLLDAFAGPATVVERGLAEALIARQSIGATYPRRAAVLGTGLLGMLATLLLRLRGVEVVTLDDMIPPLLSPRRLQGLPGWKHVRISPALVPTQLVEETGAQYASRREITLEQAAQRFGPFDVIVAGSGDSASVLSATRGLADKGVLVDLTSGNAIMDIWVASPSPCFLIRRRVAPEVASSNHALYKQAVSDLVLVDLVHPGWLARLSTCSM